MRKFIFMACFLFLAIGQTTAAQNIGETEIGKASYYSDDFNGRKTGYGDTYDMNALVGAHKRFPYGSRVRVTRLDNNKSVVVRIIDQGPYVQGRIIDLSRRAAELLGMIGMKETDVRLELLEAPGQSVPTSSSSPASSSTADERPNEFEAASRRAQEADLAPARSTPPAVTPAPPTSSPEWVSIPTPARETTTATAAPATAEPPTKASAVPAPKAAPGTTNKMLRTGDIKNGLYQIRIEQPEKKGFAVQVASLSNYDGVMRKIAELQEKWFDNILLSVEGTQYKILLGAFADEASAKRYEKDLLKRYKIKGFTVSLEEIAY